MTDFELHWEAKLEFRDAVRWYEDAQAGEGTRLTADYQQTMQRVVENPLACAIDEDYGTRFTKMKKYPYVIQFSLRRDKTIIVIAIAHESRDPGYWSHRLGK